MYKEERIEHANKLIAIVVRAKTKVDNIRFFTDSTNPLQMALHSYDHKRETNVHKPGTRKPKLIHEFHKFISITRGIATVYLMDKNVNIFCKKRLSKGDSMIIMNTFHKIVFSKNSDAIEIKQGPYEPDT